MQTANVDTEIQAVPSCATSNIPATELTEDTTEFVVARYRY